MNKLFRVKGFCRATGLFLAWIAVLSFCLPGLASAAAPRITGVSLNETRAVITLRMAESVTAVDSASLASKIMLSREGSTPSALPSGSTAVTSGSEIYISLPSSLTAAKNYVVIASGALTGQSGDLTSPNIDASGPALTANGVTVSDNRKTITLQFDSAIAGYPTNDALKNGYITLARNGSSFSETLSAGAVSIDAASGRITLSLTTALSGASARVKIAAGKLKNTDNGNLNLEEIVTPAINADFDKTPPQLASTTPSLSNDYKTVALGFDEVIYNVYATGVAESTALELFKAHVWVSRNGGAYEALSASDTISISGSTINIRFANALSGTGNRVKIDGGSLRDAAGNVQYSTIETAAFTAGGTSGAAPVYDESTGCQVSSDMKTITFTFDRNIAFVSDSVRQHIREYVQISRNFSDYNVTSRSDTVEISGNKLIVTLDEPFETNNNRIRVIANTVKSANGGALATTIYSPYIHANSPAIGAPMYKSVSYNPAKKQITVTFSTAIAAVSSYNLKNKIQISREGGSFVALSSYDTVEVYGTNSLLITLDNALKGQKNRIRVNANALRSTAGVTQNFDQTTGYIDANETTYENDFNVNLTMSADMKTADITFDRNIQSGYPYDTELNYLKQEISVARTEGGGFVNLTAYDTISISGRTLRITFQRALGQTDVIRISKNALKDSYGTVLAKEIKVGPSISNEKKIFDPSTGVTLSADKYTVTFTFTQRVYNNMASVASLKEMIRVAYDGENFEMLDAGTTVNFQSYGQLSITFTRALASPKARVKILAGALQDANSNTVTEDLITNPLGQIDEDVEVLLGGSRVYISSTEESSTSGGRVYAVTMNTTKMTSAVAALGSNTSFTVNMPDGAYGGKVILNGMSVKQLADKNSTVIVSCCGISHVFGASQLQLSEALKALGIDAAQPQNVTLEIGISRTGTPYTTDLTSKAQAKTFDVITQPTELTLVYKSGASSWAVTKYPQYVEKRFTIKPSQAQNKNITVVRVETSGKVNPVPTTIEQKSGDYYLAAKVRGNGVYGVISGERYFSDTPNWATTAVNTLASRMILQGVNGVAFRAQDAVSRAEVAEMITRALGLLTDKSGASKFLDVTLTDWYFSSTSIAVENDLIRGYGDSTFRPERSITRQEVMTIMARVMRFLDGKATGTDSTMTKTEAERILAKFKDADTVSDWAKVNMAECVKAQVVKGDDLGCLNPHANLTRTEMSQLIYNLLVRYSLISQ